MSSSAQLRAEANAADRQADVIYERINAAAVPDATGARPLIPTGFEADAARAGGLRATARALRQEAAEIELDRAPVPKPKTATPITGGSATLALASTGGGIGSILPHLSTKPNPDAEIDAVAKRIAAA